MENEENSILKPDGDEPKGVTSPNANAEDVLSLSFSDLLKDSLESLGVAGRTDLADVADYMALRTMHLATLVGVVSPAEYAEAALIERDNVALMAGVSVCRTADLADQRLVGIIQGAMRIGALALI